MYSNIVKITKSEKELFGTGIIISKDQIITSEHVVKEESEIDVEYQEKHFIGTISFKNDCIALITMRDALFSELFLNEKNKLLFTNQEDLSKTQEWEIQGFVSYDLNPHELRGNGLYVNVSPKKSCDYEVGQIIVGTLNNYEGLSGSPVICNGRAIGLVQIQSLDPSGNLGIGFSSINRFNGFLPSQALGDSAYIFELKEFAERECLAEIEKNKKSAKYIPEIFVEENDYKEYMRYFCDPILFIKEAIENVKALDFSTVNQYLNGQEIDFLQLSAEDMSYDNLHNLYMLLSKSIRRTVQMLEDKESDYRLDGSLSIEAQYVRRAAFNNSMKWTLREILKHIEYIEKRAVLLTKKAGQGKTNFLCDFTENFLIKKGIPTLYFNASNFIEKPSSHIICKLTNDGTWDTKYVKHALELMWKMTGKMVIVVIDGLNENTTLTNFGKYIEETIKELMTFPHLKIIMSTRSELLNERFPMLTVDNIGETFCHIDMSGHHNEKFNNRIFNGYLNFFDVNILGNTLLDRTYKQLVEDTLLLRFFCEVNRGKQQVYMYDIYKYSLFEEYYINKKKELANKQISGGGFLFDKLISNIARYMIETRSFDQVPKRELETDEIQLIDYLLEADVIFKEDVCMKQGFTEETIETLSFTFDEFRDYCLTRYLISRHDAVESFPVTWKTMHDLNWSIVEGVEKYIFYLARTKVPDILPIIVADDNYSSIYWDNVWNLEEKDITEDDIQKWKIQFLEDKRYVDRITSFLINRRDRKFYKKASIDLLFDIFNQLAEMAGEYDKTIRMLFPIKRVDKYNQEIRQEKHVAYCDSLIRFLEKGIEDEKKDFECIDFLKLTIYMHQVMPKEINVLWTKACKYVPDKAIKVLIYFSDVDNTALFVKQNFKDVLVAVSGTTEDPIIKELIKKNQHNVSYKKINDVLTSLWL